MPDSISLNNKFLVVGSGAAEGLEVSLDASASAEARDLVMNNAAPDKEIVLGNIKLQGTGGTDLKFLGKQGEVKFAASGSTFAGLGIYFDSERAFATLGLDDQIAPGVQVSDDPNSYYSVLRWGYDISGSAKGKIALTQGSVTFGFEGKREGLYAVVHRLQKGTKILDALKQTGDAWLIPTQIDSIDDLQPGTWLVAEVDGSIGVSLGAQFGYDLNWVRETSLGTLTGDIGLRVQLGLEVALGFKAAGKYALVVGRDASDSADKMMRLRLFKQRARGWNFAFDAGTDVTPVQKILPEKVDDFIAAVFGTHGPQIIKGIGVIEKWTDPDKTLGELFANVSADYLKDFLRETTGIEDLATRFGEAKQRLLNLIGQWEKLPHTVAAALWKMLDEGVDLTDLRALVNRLSTIDETAIRELLAPHLEKTDFFTTPIGRWLVAAAEDGILPALNDEVAFSRLREAASKTKALLDGSTVEEALNRLQKFITEHLKIDVERIEEAIQSADLDKLDEWLRARLAAFLDDKLNLGRLKDIRDAINKLVTKRQEIYEVALKALARTYEFHFSYTYEKTETTSALFDIEFDFARPGVAPFLSDAIDGRLDRLLLTPHEGVKLNTAALSHGIDRQSHVEVNLPFYGSTTDHFNTSIANVKASDEGGRVLFYDLKATDKVVAKDRARNARISKLTVGGYWQEFVAAGSNGSSVRVHNKNSLTHSYSLKQVKKSMRGSDLRSEYGSLVSQFFPNAFGTAGSLGVESFEDLIAEMDNRIDLIEFNGPNNFGNTLISFEASLPGRVLAAWLDAPTDKKSVIHRSMSLRIQAAIKRFVTLSYFSDPRKYRNSTTAGALLVYASMPPINEFSPIDLNTKLEIVRNGEYYWNWPSIDHRNVLAGSSLTATNLGARYQRVFDLLKSKKAELGIDPDDYSPGEAQKIQGQAVTTNSSVAQLLRSLVATEANIVKGAYEAARDIAKFKQNAPTSPSKAVKALAEFGAQVTSTFNSNVGSVYGGDHLRPFGSMILLEAACAFDPTFAQVSPSAILDITVLRQSVAEPSDFLEDKLPGKDQIVVQQRLVSL